MLVNCKPTTILYFRYIYFNISFTRAAAASFYISAIIVETGDKYCGKYLTEFQIYKNKKKKFFGKFSQFFDFATS